MGALWVAEHLFRRKTKIDKTARAYRLRPNKIINVFLITGLKILGTVGTFVFRFFSGKILFYEFRKAFCLPKCINLFFAENLKTILGFNNKYR